MMSAPASGAGILLRERFGPRTHRGAFPSRPPALLVLGAHNADGDVSGRVASPVRASRGLAGHADGWRGHQLLQSAANRPLESRWLRDLSPG